MDTADEREHEPVQIDLYGVRVNVQPRQGDYDSPDSWREVWRLVHRQLRDIIANSIGLISDTLKSARNLVGGIGLLPRAVAMRIASAHEAADAAERARRQAFIAKPDSRAALERLTALLQKKQAEGFTVQVLARDDGISICVLPPAEDSEAAAVLGEAAARLIETQLGTSLESGSGERKK